MRLLPLKRRFIIMLVSPYYTPISIIFAVSHTLPRQANQKC